MPQRRCCVTWISGKILTAPTKKWTGIQIDEALRGWTTLKPFYETEPFHRIRQWNKLTPEEESPSLCSDSIKIHIDRSQACLCGEKSKTQSQAMRKASFFAKLTEVKVLIPAPIQTQTLAIIKLRREQKVFSQLKPQYDGAPQHTLVWHSIPADRSPSCALSLSEHRQVAN